MYDHAEMAPRALRSPLLPPVPAGDDVALFPTTLFGPTCDGLDTVCRDVPMPRLRNGDFVLFPKFGAYTAAGEGSGWLGQHLQRRCRHTRGAQARAPFGLSCSFYIMVPDVEPSSRLPLFDRRRCGLQRHRRRPGLCGQALRLCLSCLEQLAGHQALPPVPPLGPHPDLVKSPLPARPGHPQLLKN